MRHLLLVATLLITCLFGLGPPGATLGASSSPPIVIPLRGSQDSKQREAKPKVVVRLTANRLVKGYLEREDDSIVVVRTLDNKLEQFMRARVLRVTELLDVTERPACIVHLTSGERREGKLIEDGFDQVSIESDGIVSKFPREVVDHVAHAPTVEERYHRYKEAIRGAPQHLALCEWLVQERQFKLAQSELAELLSYADSPAARQLAQVVEAQIKLMNAAPEQNDPAIPRQGEEKQAGPVDLADLLPQELISAPDANIVRVYEIDFEHPPKVNVTPETRRKLIEQYTTHPLMPSSQAERNALFRAEAIDVVRLMFDLKAREMYGEVEVQSEPLALNMFRQRVHDTWLMNSCASTQCHGGLSGGRFFLHRRNLRNERVRTTNLLILERLVLDPAWPLINYDQPQDSLLIQYALPREVARMPHADVRGWNPVFTPEKRRMLDDTIEWITSMMQPRPTYPVEYEPPVLATPAVEDGKAAADATRIDR